MFMLPNKAEWSGPWLLLWKGPMPRAVSIRLADSTRTTVAPKSAIARVAVGPATTHIRSSTLRPARAPSVGIAGAFGRVVVVVVI